MDMESLWEMRGRQTRLVAHRLARRVRMADAKGGKASEL
jgi:hypothetical protein